MDQHLEQMIYNEVVACRDDISKLKVEIAVLRVKSGVWGLIGGAIPVGIAIMAKVFL